MVTTKKLDTTIKYLIASLFMLFFVVNDLVFDFLFNFETSDYIAFASTLIASIITFICTYQIIKGNITQKADKITAFIKGNFNGWQIVFSALDIVCGLISILSGVAFLGGVFKFIKIAYIPVKSIVVFNKSKTVIKDVSKFSLVWTVSRILTRNNKGEKVMEKKKNFFAWINANKCTIGGIAVGAVTAFSGAGVIDISVLPALMVGAVNITPILYYFILGLLTILCSFFPETVEKFVARVAQAKADKEQKAINNEAKKEMKEEEKKANQTQAEQEKAKAKEEAKAKLEEEKRRKEAEHRAKIEEAKAKLLKEKEENANK